MSTWVPDKEHIDLLVKIADLLGIRDPDRPASNERTRDELGQMFVDEVVRSVSYRYPGDDVSAGELPGPLNPYYLELYVYADPGFTPNAAEMREIVRCYDYQACEHPGWKSCETNAICKAILVRLGDGPYAGPWGWDDERVAQRVAQGYPHDSGVY